MTFRAVTFDFYGTLVQWYQALEAAFGECLARHGRDAAAVPAMLARFQSAGRRLRDQPPFRPYREVVALSLAEALAEQGLSAGTPDTDILFGHISAIAPFPETVSVLTALKRRYRLGVISNTDDDLIAGSIARVGIPFDAVATAQQAGVYKPAPGLFEYAHRLLGLQADEVIHVAASLPLDMQVCKRMGLRAFWINRRGETAEPAWLPYEELPDLARLPDLLP